MLTVPLKLYRAYRRHDTDADCGHDYNDLQHQQMLYSVDVVNPRNGQSTPTSMMMMMIMWKKLMLMIMLLPLSGRVVRMAAGCGVLSGVCET